MGFEYMTCSSIWGYPTYICHIQQRVLLARALCAAKHLLVLDEPVTGLDPVVTEEFYGIIKNLNTTENVAVIMVYHDVQRAVQNATHILHMDKSPLFFGTTEDYKKTELYKSLNEMEVCETHMGHCWVGDTCTATHVKGGAKWVFGTIYIHTLLV